MSRDHSSELATGLSSMDKPATEAECSRSSMHQSSSHQGLTASTLRPSIRSADCRCSATMWAAWDLAYEDLLGFLDQSHYDVVLVRETKLRVDSEYVTSNWICVRSGTESQKQAGVMVMIRKAITNVGEVRHDAVIPGRLLRVRFPLRNDGCKLSVICAYQHAWNPKDANIWRKEKSSGIKCRNAWGVSRIENTWFLVGT